MLIFKYGDAKIKILLLFALYAGTWKLLFLHVNAIYIQIV